jgi:hypothetical protein
MTRTGGRIPARTGSTGLSLAPAGMIRRHEVVNHPS